MKNVRKRDQQSCRNKRHKKTFKDALFNQIVIDRRVLINLTNSQLICKEITKTSLNFKQRKRKREFRSSKCNRKSYGSKRLKNTHSFLKLMINREKWFSKRDQRKIMRLLMHQYMKDFMILIKKGNLKNHLNIHLMANLIRAKN